RAILRCRRHALAAARDRRRMVRAERRRLSVRVPATRNPPPLPRPGCQQRIRHQRRRKPHRLYRRLRAFLPRDADEEHRAWRRGLPLFFPVRKNLRRAEKLLRNMSAVAEIQSAIALIRRHNSATRGGVQQFVAAAADATATNPATGRTTSFRRYGPGTILDAP